MGNQPGGHNFKVALIVLENDEVIDLENPGDVMIGRLSQNQGKNDNDGAEAQYAEIDLSSYQAYETGVSRRHALLTVKSEHVTLTDMGSTNGTRLNGNLLPALMPQELHHEDILTLGKLKVQILITPT
jgi:pSer/pThr/pTyr-binding forkhead associated (FHA) protein